MEHKSLWKNFLLLTVGSLLAMHLNLAHAGGKTSSSSSSSIEGDQSEGCLLSE